MTKVKKLTNKEFKQILTDCGLDFSIWGYDGVLNMVVICLYHDAREERKNGYDLAADVDIERANKLYDELHKRGYYNF